MIDIFNMFIVGCKITKNVVSLTQKKMEKQFQLYAAPLQGLTEPAWRNAHWQTIGGVDAYFTPFVRWEKGGIRNKDRRDVAPSSNSVHRLIPQVLAAEAGEFRQLVDWLQKLGYGEVDLNMGCPFPLLVRKGRGAGILSHPDRVASLLDAMEDFPGVRFSVKMRLGEVLPEEWKELLPLLNASVVERITLHPRVGRQQYKGEVDKEQFRAFYEQCTKPLVCNGDIMTAAQGRAWLDEFPRLEGLMLGRGLVARPTLALEIRSGEEVSATDLYARVALMHRQLVAAYMERIEGGELQLVQKLQPLWEYLLPDLPKKQRKAILKAHKVEAYLQCVREALEAVGVTEES